MLPNVPKNAAEAVARVVGAAARGESVLVPVEVRVKRKLACAFCPSNASGRCRECGCFVVAKALLATEDCPLHKWR